ncbi:sulfite exporter TauE/SafE family protein [Clostridium ganghwense]|uniref:Probable membrane transporter protein n=1 Tax=Clostridium ganghwense TaxID=312089 RepID=A0ABT4CQY8_9CLOT|nr:sulfite exporter TauE/SafE family protein [Clostridium ganghwense]MCY6371477.1 sulfite exporter TauE/SafE family protein [Clostridium ganghwense]
MGLSVIILLLFIVFVGYLIQNIAGFGAVIFSLPFALLVVGRHEYVPVTLVLSILQCVYIAFKDREYIVWKEFFKMILLAFGGVPIGFYISKNYSEGSLKILLAIFIVLNSSLSLYKIYMKKPSVKELGKLKYLLPVISGCLQAAFSVGGPMISAYISKISSEKRQFRVMLCLYWCVLNPAILLQLAFSRTLNLGHVKLLIILLPAAVLGIFVGNIFISKIRQDRFEILVHCGLIASALMLL